MSKGTIFISLVSVFYACVTSYCKLMQAFLKTALSNIFIVYLSLALSSYANKARNIAWYMENKICGDVAYSIALGIFLWYHQLVVIKPVSVLNHIFKDFR